METRTADGRELDKGTAYGRKPGNHDAALTEVGPATPMGELLRRYWHPIGLREDADAVPRRVRVLGEDLILFRDGRGRPGLVHERCAHRGTTLYYGKVEQDGIRCCYHGWKYDVQGRCVERPCEPKGGTAAIRQPWYPLEERYGLIFAYMGPPDRKPLLPRYAHLEEVPDGYEVKAIGGAFGAGGDRIAPCNWLQFFENSIDHFHVPILHGSFSGSQFIAEMTVMPDVDFETTPWGVRSFTRRPRADSRNLLRVTEIMVPTVRFLPHPFSGDHQSVERVAWTLPVDDTHFTSYTAACVPLGRPVLDGEILHDGKRYDDMTAEEHRLYPDDWEAIVGQGGITLHSEEHLASSDKGVVMLRRVLRKQLDAIRDGSDPAALCFDPDAPPIRVTAGSFIEEGTVA